MSAHPADRPADGLVVVAEAGLPGVAVLRQAAGELERADLFDRVAVGALEEAGEAGARLYGRRPFTVVAGHGYASSGEATIAELRASWRLAP